MRFKDLPPNTIALVEVTSENIVDYLEPGANHTVFLVSGHAVTVFLNGNKKQMLESPGFINSLKLGGVMSLRAQNVGIEEAERIIDDLIEELKD